MTRNCDSGNTISLHPDEAHDEELLDSMSDEFTGS